MATHSSILAWKIPWTEEPGGLHPWGRKELDTTERVHTHTHTHTCKYKNPCFKKKFIILRRPFVLFVEFELECNF